MKRARCSAGNQSSSDAGDNPRPGRIRGKPCPRTGSGSLHTGSHSVHDHVEQSTAPDPISRTSSRVLGVRPTTLPGVSPIQRVGAESAVWFGRMIGPQKPDISSDRPQKRTCLRVRRIPCRVPAAWFDEARPLKARENQQRGLLSPIEKKLFTKRTLSAPTCDARVRCIVSYTSPKGQNSYSRGLNLWNFEQLRSGLTEMKQIQKAKSTATFSRQQETQPHERKPSIPGP